MELEPLPKIDKRNEVSLKKVHVDAIPANYDIIFIFRIYCGNKLQQSGRQIPHAWSIILQFLLMTTFSTISFSKGIIFHTKTLIFLQKMLTFVKLRNTWHYKEYFLKLRMFV